MNKQHERAAKKRKIKSHFEIRMEKERERKSSSHIRELLRYLGSLNSWEKLGRIRNKCLISLREERKEIRKKVTCGCLSLFKSLYIGIFLRKIQFYFLIY